MLVMATFQHEVPADTARVDGRIGALNSRRKHEPRAREIPRAEAGVQLCGRHTSSSLSVGYLTQVAGVRRFFKGGSIKKKAVWELSRKPRVLARPKDGQPVAYGSCADRHHFHPRYGRSRARTRLAGPSARRPSRG